MSGQSPARDGGGETWRWPLTVARYDRSPALSLAERTALADLTARRPRGRHAAITPPDLQRLYRPVQDALAAADVEDTKHAGMLLVLAREMHERHQAFWAWRDAVWIEILGPSAAHFSARYQVATASRHHVIAASYLLRCLRQLSLLEHCAWVRLARGVFGEQRVTAAIARVVATLLGWGHHRPPPHQGISTAVCLALLTNRSPDLERLTVPLLAALQQDARSPYLRAGVLGLSRALVALGITDQALESATVPPPRPDGTAGIAPEWVHWCERWHQTSTLAPKTRQLCHGRLLKAGRWVAHQHPEIVSPEHWTRELAAEYVAAVDRMTVGQWVDTSSLNPARIGQPLLPRAKVQHLDALKVFFRDCQEWEWLPRRFDPYRAFAPPRTLRALIAPDPRVLADDVWAKLVWAGLNLVDADLPTPGTHPHYPFPMVRAMALVWLFAGLRTNELRRLRVGCISAHAPDGGPVDATNRVCLLHVPAHKTGPAFTKPVDRTVGEAIGAWEQVRPTQPALVDHKTGEVVQYLFAYRGRQVGAHYLNARLIPLLCQKAGIPDRDARGKITSHRARATISSQLANAKEPMSLFELQAWLGHRSPLSTQHYVKSTPTRLAQAYADAGYFARNLRMVRVLIDQDAITSGTALAGEPWRFYDLGHGYCTYDFFDQCPHRMACAKCTFYVPKDSSQAQLLEGKANLQRLFQAIPLTDDERAAVEDGVAAYDRLLEQLADVPTPAGPTPRDLAHETIIPLQPVDSSPQETIA